MVSGSPSPSLYFSRRVAGRVRVPRPRTWIVMVCAILKISISVSGDLLGHAAGVGHRPDAALDLRALDDAQVHPVYALVVALSFVHAKC